MPLTQKQRAAVDRAPARDKDRLARVFASQNARAQPRQNGGGRAAQPKAQSKPSAPKQQASAAPQRSSKPSGSIFSTLDKRSVPTTHSEGPAVPVVTKRNTAETTSASVSKLYCITNTGHSATIGAYLTSGGASGGYSGNFLTGSATAGGPTSGRAMKAGVLLQNVTKALDVGGRVFVLVTDRRLEFPAAPSVATGANIQAIIDDVKAHPDTRCFGGSAFVKEGKEFFVSPRDDTDYHNYTGWEGTDTLDNFFSHCAVWPGATTSMYPMTSIWIVLDPVATTNDYQLSLRAHYYVRFPLDQVASTLSRPVPRTSPDLLHRAAQAAQTIGVLGNAVGGARSLLSAARAAAEEVEAMEGMALFL